MFQCVTDQRVPFTLVCNYREDCADGSDEDFCDYFPFSNDKGYCSLGSKPCGSMGQVSLSLSLLETVGLIFTFVAVFLLSLFFHFLE